MSRRARFITFEGIDGCGKSTQAKRLASYLKNKGIPVLLTFEPGGTGIGYNIRKILLDPKNKHISPLAELFLYMADRAQHIKEVIGPSLEKGIWVISDRFYDATLAYQGFGRGIDISFIDMLNQKACGKIRPDITFLMDCPVETAIIRISNRIANSNPDKGQLRFEQEDLRFHEMVRKGYLSIAARHKDRIVMVDATSSIDEIERFIINKIEMLT
ncbi:MAG: dTMP kinase [Deltaproteobacteria bacterium]|nr:MAG: dTMP kinase [Deltaproteobacteria bacterium]